MGVAAAAMAAQTGKDAPVDVSSLLARVGDRVEAYFTRAQSLICRETVRLQSLRPDLMPDGSHARHLVYDLRVAWEPAKDDDPSEASVLRDIVTVDGRPPRPRDEPGCMDPKPVSAEPLMMLLPHKQSDYAFTWAGLGKVDGRAAAMLDYRSLEKGDPTVTVRDDCISVEVPGRNRGRIWIDQETGDVLRLDERLTGMIDFDVPPDRARRRAPSAMTIERADTSIRYRRVTFENPEETLMLPATIDTVTVIRNSGAPRMRKTQRFSDYRRFVTEGRIVQ
jgi:hypothetical protein